MYDQPGLKRLEPLTDEQLNQLGEGRLTVRTITRVEFERDYPRAAAARAEALKLTDAYAEQARTGFAVIERQWYLLPEAPWWRRLFRKLED